MAGLLRRLARTGLRRGLRDGSRGWLLVGVTASALTLARRFLAEDDVAATLDLHPGDAVEIRVLDPSP